MVLEYLKGHLMDPIKKALKTYVVVICFSMTLDISVIYLIRMNVKVKKMQVIKGEGNINHV